MKHIDKKTSPKEFENWKQQYRSGSGKTLQELYESDKSGNDLWSVLPSSPIEEIRREEEFFYYSKQELRLEIIKEQGYICCYCNQEVKDNTTSILEHFKPKGLEKHKKLTFDYQNILISCNGGQKDPKPRELHCDAVRNEGDELLLSPLQEDIENLFDFTKDGQVIGVTDAGKEMVERLGLKIEKLRNLRESAIRAFIYQNPFELELQFLGKEDAKKEIQSLKQLQNGKYEPFCAAIIKVLENEIIKGNDE